MENAKRAMEMLDDLLVEGEMPVDETLLDRFTEIVAPAAEPEFETAMISGGGLAGTSTGEDGMRAALKDWFGTFSTVRFVPEGMREVGENVLVLVNQVATTRQGIELEQPSATVFKFRDGRIHRVEWHLDRATAERSAAET